jgi:hypothetical protein
LDNTFEVQIRTVLSEGWHEVEHDLRYKARDTWDSHKDLSRALNGILATIETCDWGVLRLLDELTLRYYESEQWAAMLRTRLRLRLVNTELRQEICDLFGTSRALRRDFFRFPRAELLSALLESGLRIPLSLDNLCFIINRLTLSSQALRNIEPRTLEVQFHRANLPDFPSPTEGLHE